MVETVVWDLDHTLYDFALAERNSVCKCWEDFGFGTMTESMIQRYSDINLAYWKRVEKGEFTIAEILILRFRDFFKEQGIDPALAVDFNSSYMNGLPDTNALMPHALETLEAVKAMGVPQYVASNGGCDQQFRKLRGCGIQGFFDKVFISEQVGFQKPSRAFFDKVCEGHAPGNMLMVGDSLSSDMKGALDAGMMTCLYCPSGAFPKTDMPLDFMVSSLLEVPALVSRQIRRPR